MAGSSQSLERRSLSVVTPVYNGEASAAELWVRTFDGREGGCPITEKVAERLLRLPFYTGMIDLEQMVVIEAVRAFRC